MTQRHSNYWPTGSLKRIEDILDLVIEARKTKRAIRVYTVTQLGYIDEFYLTSKTKLYRPGATHPTHSDILCQCHTLYPVFDDHSCIGRLKTNTRWFRTDELLESYGVGNVRYSTEHRMFTNQRAALEYSQFLKNDPVYIQEVREWHDHCAELFQKFH